MVAIDLGSNTIRFIEFNGTVWGKSFEKIVRTAENIGNTQCIGEQAIERIVDAIDEARAHIDLTQPVRAYTTAAMRFASNSSEVLQRIYECSGVSFEIIDAKKEAMLTLDAVRYRMEQLGNTPPLFLLADIGGGSTELTRCEGNNIETVSLNFGIVTMSEETQRSMDEKIAVFKSNIEKHSAGDSISLVLTAGTPTTIAAYLNGMDYEHYDPRKINGYRLKLSDCYRVYDELLQMNESIRIRYVGVGRENLIMAGILMVTTIYEAIGTDEAIIIDDGLREGIALEYYKMS